MRDFNLTHIPDLTERYPEGFDGVDMYSMNMDMYYEDYYIDDFPRNYEVRGDKYYGADDLEEAKELQREHGGVIYKYNPETGDYDTDLEIKPTKKLSDYEQDMRSIAYLIDGPKKFEEGQEYESVCWFTGGVGYYTVKKRTDKEITFTIGRHELDGDHKCEDETFELKFDKHGNEYITLYEYGDHENNIRAGYDGYGNEIY